MKMMNRMMNQAGYYIANISRSSQELINNLDETNVVKEIEIVS